MWLPVWTSANPHSCQQDFDNHWCESWHLRGFYSVRGRRKRCQHDPGSRLWRGSGGKSKTVHLVPWQQRRCSHKVLLPAFLAKVSLTQMIPPYEASIVLREDAKMTGCLWTQVKVNVTHQPASQDEPLYSPTLAFDFYVFQQKHLKRLLPFFF